MRLSHTFELDGEHFLIQTIGINKYKITGSSRQVSKVANHTDYSSFEATIEDDNSVTFAGIRSDIDAEKMAMAVKLTMYQD